MIHLVYGDITSPSLGVDCIVNPGNETLCGCFAADPHNCLDKQIHAKAGSELKGECFSIMKGKKATIGKCILTEGYDLPCSRIIHVYGPNAHLVGLKYDLLKQAYVNCFQLASENHIRSLAIPAISTGEYGFPKDLSAETAVRTVYDCMKKQPPNCSLQKVVLVCNDKETYDFYLKIIHEITEKK